MRILLAALFLAATGDAAPPAPAAPKTDKDITPLLTSSAWKWDHPAAKGRVLKFRKDGTCESTLWKGVWKITSPRHVQITIDNQRREEIDFNEEVTAFTGTHYDGQPIVGRREGEVPSSLR